MRWGVAAAAALLIGGTADAHPGGLDAEGCHNDRKRGGYHCHRGGDRAPRAQGFAGGPSGGRLGIYYPNCAAARAAGAARVRRGEPGYGSHLDRDGDGRACKRCA